MFSYTNRVGRSDDDIISESEYNDNNGKNNVNNTLGWFCCCKCNRIHVEQDYEDSSRGSISISSKTLESVQDAIDGKISLSKAKLHRYLTTINWGQRKK